MMLKTIQHFYGIRQDAMDSSLKMVIHNIIGEYGEYDTHHESVHVNLKNIDLSDKKILLSHIASAEFYEDALLSHERFSAWFDEYLDEMSYLVNKECDDFILEQNYERKYSYDTADELAKMELYHANAF